MEEPKHLVTPLDGTPYTLIESENGQVAIVIGDNLIRQGYKNREEAEKDIIKMLRNNPLLVPTIFALAKGIVDNYTEITAIAEENQKSINDLNNN